MNNQNLVSGDYLSSLVYKAVDGMDTSDFAMKAGIGLEELGLLLSADNNIDCPSEEVLARIADASDGRVSKYELLFACGKPAFPMSDVKVPSMAEGYDVHVKYNNALARHFVYCCKQYFLDGGSYPTVEHALRSVAAFCGINASISTYESRSYHGGKHGDATRYMHCLAIWHAVGVDYYLYFTAFGRVMDNNRVMVTDVAFDACSLWSLGHPGAMRMILDLAEKGDVDFSKFDITYFAKERLTREEKFLKAIFSADYAWEDAV